MQVCAEQNHLPESCSLIHSRTHLHSTHILIGASIKVWSICGQPTLQIFIAQKNRSIFIAHKSMSYHEHVHLNDTPPVDTMYKFLTCIY